MTKTTKDNKDNKESTMTTSIEDGLDTPMGSLQDEVDFLDETYEPPTQLFVPKAMIERYRQEGFELHWVRVIDPGTGKLDVVNIRAKEQDMYTFINSNEAKEMQQQGLKSFFPEEEINLHTGLLQIGDVALAKIPIGRKQQKRRYYDNLNRKSNEALLHDLKSHAIGDKSRGDVFTTERTQPTVRSTEFGN
jgi:hypothetical protein